MLSEYLEPHQLEEISYKEILAYIKERRRVPFHAPDIAELAADYIHEQGVKVWR